MRMDPGERIPALDALAHPYFEGIREPHIDKLISQSQVMRRRSSSKSRGGGNRDTAPSSGKQRTSKYITPAQVTNKMSGVQQFV
jgi:hypothetical protein